MLQILTQNEEVYVRIYPASGFPRLDYILAKIRLHFQSPFPDLHCPDLAQPDTSVIHETEKHEVDVLVEGGGESTSEGCILAGFGQSSG